MSSAKGILNKKKVLIIGTIILIILVIVSCCIYFATRKKQEEVADESDLLVQGAETYEGLNYISKKETILSQSYFYDLDRGIDGSKIDISYLSVDGLKNNELENKINNSLKETAQSLYDETSLENPQVLYDHVYNYTDVYIFNNVLSTMFCRELCDIEGNITYEYKGLNINLKAFEPFNFKDIFINTTNYDEILSQDMRAKVDDGTVIFSVSPKEIYVYNEQDKRIEKINLYKNREYVAIYKRFYQNNKLFDKTYNAKPYIFTTKKFYETDSYGLVDNNIFIDTVNKYATGSKYNEKVMDSLDTLYKSAVSASKNKAYSNPSKRFLVQIVPNIEEKEDGYLNLSVIYTIFEVQKDFFNDKIEEFVIASENRSEEEIVRAEYFNKPIMEADDYLIKTETEIIEKIVDTNGNEKVDNSILIQGES